METETIGSRIRAARKEMGYSQEELAALLYMKKTTICKYEKDLYDICSIEVDKDRPSSLTRTSIVSKLNTKPALHPPRPDLYRRISVFAGSMEQHTCLTGLLKRQVSLVILESAMAHWHPRYFP